MRKNIMWAGLLAAALLLCRGNCFADSGKDDDALQLVAQYTYHIGPEDSRETHEALGLFGARYKAVALAAKYLAHKGLLADYGSKEKEIFCLAANEIDANIVESSVNKDEQVYFVKINAAPESVDFIRAEIRNRALEKEEKNFSWQKEMEQPVMKTIDPALELSRAYRYLRKKQWRIAVIYLDHLQKKYPHWSALYLAKAIGLYATHNMPGMMEALRTSCSLGNREACEDMEGMVQSNIEGMDIYDD